jgi:hypothetical protein
LHICRKDTVVVVSLKSGPTLENPSQPEVSNVAAIYTKGDTTTISASVPSDEKDVELNFTVTSK